MESFVMTRPAHIEVTNRRDCHFERNLTNVQVLSYVVRCHSLLLERNGLTDKPRYISGELVGFFQE